MKRETENKRDSSKARRARNVSTLVTATSRRRASQRDAATESRATPETTTTTNVGGRRRKIFINKRAERGESGRGNHREASRRIRSARLGSLGML